MLKYFTRYDKVVLYCRRQTHKELKPMAKQKTTFVISCDLKTENILLKELQLTPPDKGGLSLNSPERARQALLIAYRGLESGDIRYNPFLVQPAQSGLPLLNAFWAVWSPYKHVYDYEGVFSMRNLAPLGATEPSYTAEKMLNLTEQQTATLFFKKMPKDERKDGYYLSDLLRATRTPEDVMRVLFPQEEFSPLEVGKVGDRRRQLKKEVKAEGVVQDRYNRWGHAYEAFQYT